MIQKDLFIQIRGFLNQIHTKIDRQMRVNKAGHPDNSIEIGWEKG